jgi:diguanylate cyclase (GGDEF)-like protein
MTFSWDTVGPRAEERKLAGKVAGVLWLFVPPMLFVGLLLPGSATHHLDALVLITLPAALWGFACLVIRWETVTTPLLFHVPASLALPYIAFLVAWTGSVGSPFGMALLMLLVFAAYFFTMRAAIPYLIGCLVVQAMPLAYDSRAVDAGVLPNLWVSLFVFVSMAVVVMAGKQQLVGLREEARDLSLHDSLTNLVNRRALREFLEDHRERRRRTDALGLLMLDLDDFKEANTLYGLPGGDRVLCAVAQALRGLARSDDIIVRLGGDEFAIALVGVTEGGMHRLAERALQSVRDTGAELNMPGYQLTASAGWALYPADADSTDQLLAVADLSLRAAKLDGKNTFHSPVEWSPEAAT